VLVAENGKDGLDTARKSRPELVILDLMMPQTDGYQVIDALRQAPETSNVPIIVYTARPVTRAVEERLAGKVQAILKKGDFNKERFLDLVHRRGERRSRGGSAGSSAERQAA
jgi:threonine synthase